MGRRATVNTHLPSGMRARRQKSGKTYYYYDTGKKPRIEIPLGDDFVMAVKKWAELESEKSNRVASLITFRYVAERYTRDVLPTKADKTQACNLSELQRLYEFFGDAPIEDIQPLHIRKYLDSRKSAPVMANREKSLFSHIFNKAREWGLTDRANPCQGIKRNKETGRDIYVEDDAYAAVYAHADQPTKDAMDLAYLTGQRPADVLKLDERDIKDGVLLVTQNKTGAKLRISVTGELAEAINRIMERKQRTGEKVRFTQLIVNEKGSPIALHTLQQRFIKARIKAGIDKDQFQFRDLRAKAATDKSESSGMRAAQRQLGHANMSMTEIYTRERKGSKVSPTK